jgi:putative membrane-bound dehydrogenase-like protein
VAAAFLLGAGPLFAQREFGFVNTQPSGQPYLSPEESVKRMQVQPGWEVTVFAAEPDIINPISFTVDERGRLWVVECYEYPKRTPKGKKPRDRIKVLEDTTGAGKADKVTVWAEGKDLPTFDLASGIEVGNGGVYLGAAPYLFFLQDKAGQGKCDHHEILLKGFGSGDTHEVLNTLQWGPDGRLYGLEGIFTQSEVGSVKLDAAVWRYDTAGRMFDIFAEGTSNPWGLDFDPHGQAFLTACVIPHCFHIIPGGRYIRQAGQSLNPYTYGLLREISDHMHHAESGWAHAGALVLQGDGIPDDLRGSLLMGSIHGCSIKRDVLVPSGSTFIAKHAPDFVVSGDKNFRPVNLRWGPGGSIYVIDWHDQNPCHQALPDSWDMTHGRIYKIQRKGVKPSLAPDLSKKSTADLVELLKNNNPWWYRTALRLLRERQDPSAVPLLKEILVKSKEDTLALRAMWALYALGASKEELASKALHHSSPWVRSWAIRLLGEKGGLDAGFLQELNDLARNDPSAVVRLQLASTCQRLKPAQRVPLLQRLMQTSSYAEADDPCIPLMIWLACEPTVVPDRDRWLSWLPKQNGRLIAGQIVPRMIRRLLATGTMEDRAACVAFLKSTSQSDLRLHALQAFLQALENQQLQPPANWPDTFQTLRRDTDRNIVHLTRRLAVIFRDPEALRRSLEVAQDKKRPVQDRIDAVHDLAAAHPADALRPLESLLARESSPELRVEICRALSAYTGSEIPQVVLKAWKTYPPAVRTEAVNLLAGRKEWARELLVALGHKEVEHNDLNNNTIARMRALRDPGLNEQIEKVWGSVRESSSAELNALIGKMRAALDEGPSSFERGRKVFENNCAKCHRFEGKGHDVGPNLDGAGRDIEYLLVNILDPNRVVGQPYFARFVTLKNGRIETGLLAAEDNQSITLKGENDALKVIPKKDIDEITVQQKSLMPEGLSNSMTVQDFRDLIRYVMADPFISNVEVTNWGTLRKGNGGGIPPNHMVAGPSGRIYLPKPEPKSPDNRADVVAEVIAPEDIKARLLFGAGYALQVCVNDKVVYEGKPGVSPARPDQAGCDVDLKKGTNRLRFVIDYRGNNEFLYVRFHDPHRKLRYPE